MREPVVCIITPTYRQKDMRTFTAMLGSVSAQTYPHWKHVILSDGEDEPAVRDLMQAHIQAQYKLYGVDESSKREYVVTEKHHGGYGSGVRQEAVKEHMGGEYVCFLDDDNVLFPDYLEYMVQCLRAVPHAGAIACRIVQCAYNGDFFTVSYADPVFRAGGIDTLQVLATYDAMAEVGWHYPGSYCADGLTYQRLAMRYPVITVDAVLAIHL